MYSTVALTFASPHIDVRVQAINTESQPQQTFGSWLNEKCAVSNQ
jgi:hypothetical protein